MATLPTIPNVITRGEISTYKCFNQVAKNVLYPKSIGPPNPVNVALFTDILYWHYASFPPIYAVNAIGSILITGIGNNGDNIEVLVDDPQLGNISLGSYTKQSGDTTTTILAASVASALSGNSYGYSVSSSVANVNITARNGLGGTINGGGRLTVSAVITPEHKALVQLSPTPVSTGTVFTITVDDPDDGVITLAIYTQQAGDTTQAIFISNMVDAINTNIYGYTCAVFFTTSFRITARTGLGSTINGNIATIAWNSSTTFNDFGGGVNGVGLIPDTITQFSGGVTADVGDSTLRGVANYAVWLYGIFGIQAQAVSGGGGSVVPVVPGVNSPNRLDFFVSDTTPIATGQSQVFFNSGQTDFRGYILEFDRGNQPQGMVSDGSNTYFTWNRATGEMNIFGVAVEGEPMAIIPS
jgi:hypothetical protein